MTYSRKRILVIGCLWLVAGFAGASVYGVPSLELPGADAQGGTNCGSAPCQFPAEAHVGGIVLGTSFLEGEDANTFGDPSFICDGGNDSSPCAGVPTPLPPDRVDKVDATVGLGVESLSADDFFLYKSWKYDPPSQQNADVNVWINTTFARIGTEPIDDPSSGAICGNDQTGFGGSEDCDLLINAGELSTGYFLARVQNDIPLFGGNLDSEEYWIDDPELDRCGVAPPELCLELLRDGFVQSIPFVNGVDVDLYNFMTRTHYAKALRANDNNKVLQLNDGYLEIRYGKGADRSRVVPFGDNSNTGSPGTDFGRADQWQKPISEDGGNNPTERNGVSQGFICQSGADGDTDCDPQDDPPPSRGTDVGPPLPPGFNPGDDGDRIDGDEFDGSYDDIHDPADNTAP